MRACVGLVLVVLGACSQGPTTALFVVPGEGVADDFYELPFPNDLRRKEDGTLDLSAFPTNSLIVETYRAAAEELDGFGLNQPVFARFTDWLDVESLPDPAASVLEDASVYLVDVDPDSPAFGTRSPIVVTFRVAGTATLGANNLVARPYPGFGLVDGTTYALVITNRVLDAYGNPVIAAGMFSQVMGSGGTAGIAHARAVYQPLLDWLDQPDGDERSDVVSAAVFTTQHATRIVPAIRKGIYGGAAPVATGITEQAIAAVDIAKKFHGSYEAPNFQRGAVPYHEGGDIVVGPDGAAIVQRSETMRFSLTVPIAPMPTAGYPIAIYSHGTGGDFETYFEDGTALRLIDQGIATISTDQVLHGPRNPGGDPQIDFFNFANPLAARDNSLQGTADAFSQHRLVAGLVLPGGIKFDPAKIYFFGHSQGGTTGPGYVAFEPTLTGAVFSGTSGHLTISLLNKTLPLDIPELLGTLVRDDPMDVDNPSLGLVQMWMERADPVNYAPFMVRRPGTAPDGSPLAPRNIFQTEGFTDRYSPNPGIEAFAVALGVDLAMVPDHQDILGVTLRGGSTRATPITDNAGTATCVLAQYNEADGSDGHFVVFDINLARRQTAQFLGTLARTGKATVVSSP